MGKSFVHQENPVVTGIETYTEKNLPSESYSAADYRIGRIVSWGRCDKRNKQKNPLRSLPLYDESYLDYEYIHPIKWIPEISLSVLTLSLLLAIRWRTMIISELRRIIGWFWVAQAKNVSFAPCTYARSTIVPAIQVW